MRRSAHPILRRLGAGLAIGAALVGTSAAGMMTAAAAVTATPDTGYAVSINQGNVPTTAADVKEHSSCGEFGSKAATDDGWLFVASPDDFASFEAVFDQGKVFYKDPGSRTSDAGTSVAFPKQYDHLAVTTPAGWKLINAYANLTPPSGKTAATFFTLSHTCAATDQPPPPTAAAPTVSFTNDCEAGGIVVTLGNVDGTAQAHFTVTYGGSDHLVDVDAGDSQPVTVPVGEDTTGSVTVSAEGLDGSPVTRTWERNCSTDTQEQTPAPTASLAHSCEIGGFRVTLGNVDGTAPAAFTVHYNGADHSVTVPAGTTTQFTVPVTEDTTASITVAAAGLTTQSDSWSRDCSQTVPPEHHGVNPAVAFSTACTTGITVQLSNMKFDDTTVDAVTFTITTPSGAQEQVVVLANQITKRSYGVAEGTTGAVTVEAPGLAKQTKSYAKKCTSVLGEKVTKGPKTTKTPKTPKPAVEGDKVVALPATGAPTGAMVEGSMLLLLAAFGLSIAGRRRYQPRHATR